MQQIIRVFTDGATKGNHVADAGARLGGIGVFFGENDPRNVSERFIDEPITNQRAELAAIHRALKTTLEKSGSPPPSSVVIYSDSMYAINVLRSWAAKWRSNGWTRGGSPLCNLDIIRPMYRLYRKHEDRITLEHVRAHRKKKSTFSPDDEFKWRGNMMADKLATAACVAEESSDSESSCSESCPESCPESD